MNIECDISIVGCGPVGATLANLLADFGHSIALFEKETEIYRAPRAIHIDDEVIRIFQNVGILEELQESILPFHSMQFVGADGRVLLETQVPPDHTPFGYAPFNWFFQPTLESKLRNCLKEKEQIQWFEGYEVHAAESSKDAASLTAINAESQEKVEVRSSYIIGCDGGKSRIRKWMDIQFENLDFDQAWMVVDTFLKEEKDVNLLPDKHQQICNPQRPTTYVPGVGLHRRFEFMLVNGETKEGISKPESINQLITPFIDPHKLNIARSAVYTFHGLIADQWKNGRFILAGDSAHQMPPFAGQGMCSGIRDAHNLAFKLDLVLTGKAYESLLDSYQLERKPHVTAISKGAINMGQMIQTQNKLKAIFRDFQFFLARNYTFILNKLEERFIQKLPYEKGLLGKAHALSGHLTIQPLVHSEEGKELLLDELLGNRFVVISTSTIPAEQVNDVKNKLNGQVLLLGQDFTSPEYEAWMQENKMEFILIRPDRYIFDAGKMLHVAKVLQTLFKMIK